MSEIVPTRIDSQVQDAKPKLKKPRLYKVVLLNDDYTPMEFVVHILQKFFAMQEELAVSIMLKRPPKRQWNLWRIHTRNCRNESPRSA